MRTIPRFLFLVSVVSSSMNPLLAQWVQTHGPYLGRVTCLATIGTSKFAGTQYAGVLISTNSGASWTRANVGLADTNVLALAASGPNLLAGTGSGLFFLSTDSGAHWAPSNAGASWWRAFFIDGDSVYAQVSAGDGQLIWLSTNRGVSWAEASTPFKELSSMVRMGSTLYAGVNSGVYQSTDNGASWSQIYTGPLGAHILCFAVNGTNLFAGTYGGGVFLSTNQGTSWKVVNTGLVDTNIRTLAVSGENVYAGTDVGLFVSTDNGSLWQPVDSIWSPAVFALDASGTNLLVGTSAGISVSTDNGSSWTTHSAGGNSDIAILSLASNGTELYAAAACGGGGPKGGWPSEYLVFHSTDAGETWVPQLASAITYVHEGSDAGAFVIRTSDVFVGTLGNGVFRSTNHGMTWTAVNEGLPTFEWGAGGPSGYAKINSFAAIESSIFAAPEDLFHAPEGWGIYRTTDNGTSWTAVNNGLRDSNVIALAVSGTAIFAGTADSGVFRSTSNGSSWTAVNTGLTNSSIRSLVCSGTGLFAGTYDGIFHSSDSGTHWTAVKMGSVAGLTANGRYLLARIADSVFVSTDKGVGWSPGSTIPAFVPYGANPITMNATHIFMGSGGIDYYGPRGFGLWRRPLSEMITSVEPLASESPREFSLQQNYPNPFNPSSDIRYQISEFNSVRLAVYDVLGREVAVLVNERKAPGTYQVRFDGANLPSGMYFYRLQAGSHTETRRLLLLR